MDNFTPRVTDCADFTGTGIVMTSTGGTASPGGPTGTGSGGVAETASAGENGGGSLRVSTHSFYLCCRGYLCGYRCGILGKERNLSIMFVLAGGESREFGCRWYQKSENAKLTFHFKYNII